MQTNKLAKPRIESSDFMNHSMNEHACSESSGAFPTNIEMVLESERVSETFGLMPLIFGSVLMWFAVFAHLSLKQAPKGSDWVLLIAGSLAGALLVAYDFLRRQRRLTLVRKGNQIGLYRQGLFRYSVEIQQVTFYILDFGNTLKLALLVLFMTVGLGALAFTLEFIYTVMCLALVVATNISFWHTRLRCEHFYFPRQKGRFQRSLLLTKKRYKSIIT